MTQHLDLERSAAALQKLLDICSRKGRILVLMQNNPDPDAIASAIAVRTLVSDQLDKHATIGYAGIIGRAENKAMVDELRFDLRKVEPAHLDRYKLLCLVDTQPRSGNNALLTARPADVVIDHHVPPKKSLWKAEFSDIRPEYGATSTILYEYLQVASIKPDVGLATALYYGIQADTQELGREASPADITAFQTLVPLADARRLARIRRAPVPVEYFAAMRESLSNAVIAGKTVIVLIRDAPSPDMFAEVADMMLRLDIVRTAVCYGPVGDTIFLSMRAGDARGNLAERMKRVVSHIGTGGGHRSMAGGQVPIIGDRDKRLRLVRDRILKVFASNQACKSLIPETDAVDQEDEPA